MLLVNVVGHKSCTRRLSQYQAMQVWPNNDLYTENMDELDLLRDITKHVAPSCSATPGDKKGERQDEHVISR